ncbi:MAG: DUF2779 domain-containing protein, partial [Cyanobacteria bacterium]|nr:DUF2779 domain-containing protein [Cyanobacteriota bacterium]
TSPRHLTKSRFKLGLECPVKLFYTRKKEYKDQKQEDSFLEALAEGGFQVGELAKYKYPAGVDIKTLDYDEALKQTNKELEKDQVTIYEAAVQHGDLFIRVDVLKKTNNVIELIEVKAKSYDQPDLEKDPFIDQRNKKVTKIAGKWAPYLNDIAFQYYVASQAFPAATIIPKLLLVDKSKLSVTDGLNQKFKIIKDNGRKKVILNGQLSPEDLENDLLIEINVQDYIDIIYATEIKYGEDSKSFAEQIQYLADLYKQDQRAPINISAACKYCEFKTKPCDEAAGCKSGFKECWTQAQGWTEEDFVTPHILDIWKPNTQKFIEKGKLKIHDFCEDDFKPQKPSTSIKPGLSQAARQWLQVNKAQMGDLSPYINHDSLRIEMSSWKFPLHFIDFETSMVAIPFTKGMRPYEQIAFQFSHHKINQDGSLEHANEFIFEDPGKFPNFEFIKALKTALEPDNGTIFRYSAHENTVLNKILEQLRNTQEKIEGKQEIIDFILSITQLKDDRSALIRAGERNMVDLLELVIGYYYHPDMKGSNSIKSVLPAILNSSEYLKTKYSKPIYGSASGIPSFNFTNQAWVQFDANGQVQDPYKKLPDLYEGYSNEELDKLELFSDETQLNNGGAAMTAYARMQFAEMSDIERQELKKALLQYCELDTLAMVMIYEAWREEVETN